MRKFFAKVHLWLSIPFGIIIAIVCLTGAILVFETEILELGYPSRFCKGSKRGTSLACRLDRIGAPTITRFGSNKRYSGIV